jgi:hypothetical protein
VDLWCWLLTRGVVLVRRVVEARRIAANGGSVDAPPRTAALPPMNEKDGASSNQAPEKSKMERERFWKRLRCW